MAQGTEEITRRDPSAEVLADRRTRLAEVRSRHVGAHQRDEEVVGNNPTTQGVEDHGSTYSHDHAMFNFPATSSPLMVTHLPPQMLTHHGVGNPIQESDMPS